MGKRPEVAALDVGTRDLAAEGIDQEALAAGSPTTERLGTILSAGTEASIALAHLLGTVPRQEHADLLAAADATTHGALRREVRRALYRLRQSGIEPARMAPAPPRASAITQEEPEAWISYIDGRGDQLVWITKPSRGALFFVSARINDGDGMCEVAAVEISKRQFRAKRADLAERHRLQMVPVSWRHADALLTAAQARGSQQGSASYLTLRSRITDEPAALPEPAAPPEPPIYDHIARDAVDPSLTAVSPDLLKEPELQSWLPSRASLEPYVREIMEVRESPLVLSQPQQEDRLSGIVDRAARELYPSDVWAPRLETMAFYLWATGRDRQARVALAAAHALAAGATAEAVPVLATFAREGLSAVYEIMRARAQEQERESVLIKPGAHVSGPATRR
jgi:hypothetical protein